MTIARASDPSTSHNTAEEISQDGTRSAMIEKTLTILRENPGSTANELESIGGYKDGQLRKRLHDLFQMDAVVQGPIRDSRVTGKPNITWYATEHAPLDAVRYRKKPQQPKQVTVAHHRNGETLRTFKTFVLDRDGHQVVTFPQTMYAIAGDEVVIQ